MSKIIKTFIAILNDPATFIAFGSVFMSLAMGGYEGAYLNAAAVLLIAALKGYESWVEHEVGKPFVALALVNFGTAASIGGHAFHDFGFSVDAFPQYALTIAYVLSGIRSSLLAWHQRRSSKPQGFIDDPQFYEGLGAIAIARGGFLTTVCSLLGIARTLMNKKFLAWEDEDKKNHFLLHHYTAARAYAFQYFIGACIASSFPEFLSLLFWSWGFSRFDLSLNYELRRHIFSLKVKK